MKNKKKIKELEKRIKALEDVLENYWLTPSYPFRVYDNHLKPPWEITCERTLIDTDEIAYFN